MEQNLPVAAKKVWNLVRLMLLVLKKGVSKRKLLILLDLNMMMKRGKIAGKALQDLMFNHHHRQPFTDDYEFSCSNTPTYPLSLFSQNKKHHYKRNYKSGADDDDQMIVIKAIEMLTASPALPGFGKSPMVRQLRVTDSPFPLSNGDEDSYVDEAAEKFIMKFYSELRRQN